jgi:hypothetical protein
MQPMIKFTYHDALKVSRKKKPRKRKNGYVVIKSFTISLVPQPNRRLLQTGGQNQFFSKRFWSDK